MLSKLFFVFFENTVPLNMRLRMHPQFITVEKWPVFLQNAYGNLTVGHSLIIFVFYIQCLTVDGVSQPSSTVPRKNRISQGPRSY